MATPEQRHEIPLEHLPAPEPLFKQMIVTQRRLNALNLRLIQAVHQALDQGYVDDEVFDQHILQYRKAASEAVMVYQAWMSAGYPGLPIAPDGPFSHLAAQGPAAREEAELPAQEQGDIHSAETEPSPRLLFARWLSAQGRISG